MCAADRAGDARGYKINQTGTVDRIRHHGAIRKGNAWAGGTWSFELVDNDSVRLHGHLEGARLCSTENDKNCCTLRAFWRVFR